MDANLTVAIIGIVILSGVFLKHMSKKSNWPLSLLLLIVGVFVGPVFGILDAKELSGAIESFAIIALIIVLFDVGYEIKIYRIKQLLKESTALAFVGVASTLAVVSVIAHFLLGFNIYLSLLFGALLASTDLTIISPLIENMKLKETVKEALAIEATLNSVIAAVLAIIIGTILTYNTSILEAVTRGLFYHVLTGIAVGLMIGWILLKTVNKLQFDEMPALVTIGSVLVVYAATEMIGASGIIAALIVGILYGNADPAPPRFVMSFGENLQVILVTFVYIMLGVMVQFEAFVEYSLIAAVLVTSIIAVRYFAVKLVKIEDRLLAQRVVGISGPRGIISAILILTYAHFFPDPNLVISLGFAVILCTSLAVFLLPVIEEKTNSRTKAGVSL
jgi:NhaP-type Na+/H+ or K+/H+ antiporter